MDSRTAVIRLLWILWTVASAVVMAGNLPQTYCQSKKPGNYQHPTDCGSFIICTHGRTIIQSCGGGMHYDHGKQLCDYAYNVPCDASTEYLPGSPVPQPQAPVFGAPAYDPAAKDPRQDSSYQVPKPPPQQKVVPPKRAQTKVESKYAKSGPAYAHNFIHQQNNNNNNYNNGNNYNNNNNKIEQSGSNHYVHTPDPSVFANFNRVSGYGNNNQPQSYVPQYPPPAQSFTSTYSNEPQYAHNTDCRRDGLYRDPTDCTTYLQCSGGHKYRQICPFGTAFNPKTESCGVDSSVCSQEVAKVIVPSSPSTQGSDRDSNKVTLTVNLVPELSSLEDTERLGKDLMERMRTFFAGEASMAARRTLTNMLRVQSNMARNFKESQSPFSRVAAFLGASPYTKQLAMPAFEQLECIRILRKRFSLNRAQLKTAMADIPTSLKPSGIKAGPDRDFIKPKMGVCPFALNTADNDCDRYSKYRTFDGSCNNLKFPQWGKSFRNLARLISPDYADGIGEPRQSRSGNFLPSARSVSLGIHQGKSDLSHILTVMHQTFGQFLDHDLDRTAITKLSKDEEGTLLVNVKCGESGCETQGEENAACLPIQVPAFDTDFKKECLKFVRTQESTVDNCALGPREQLNQITSYLDASMIYGNTKNDTEKLRDRSFPGRAPLKLTPHPFNRHFKGLLPQKSEVSGCMDNNATVECFTAGDGRVNEQVGLSAMHHVWHRGHNSIESILHSINPHWNAETLFQESRRIIFASWQYITYNEYLPTVFGQENLRKFGLLLNKHGYWNGYDESVNVDVSNSFATAAFRFGHSQIADMIRFSSQIYRRFEEINFSQVFDRPYRIYTLTAPDGASGVDSIILGMLSQRTEVADRFFSKEVTARLFSDNPPKLPGMDLVSINIQRGRDHGLPGYMEWREYCGLYRARDFEDLRDLSDPELKYKFKTLYENVDDIDLYAGGMAEEHLPGAMIGPTFACIMGREFHNARVGDRFWFERDDPVTGFTPGQLNEIRKFTQAYYICQNLDYVDTIQKFVMMQPYSEAVRTIGRNRPHLLYDLASLYKGEKNERAPCSDLPQPNFNEWRDNPRPQYNFYQ